MVPPKIILFIIFILVCCKPSNKDDSTDSSQSLSGLSNANFEAPPLTCEKDENRKEFLEKNIEINCISIKTDQCNLAKQTFYSTASVLPLVILSILNDYNVSIVSKEDIQIHDPYANIENPIFIEQELLLVSLDPSEIKYSLNKFLIDLWLSHLDFSESDLLTAIEHAVKSDLEKYTETTFPISNIAVLSAGIDSYYCNQDSRKLLDTTYPETAHQIRKVATILEEAESQEDGLSLTVKFPSLLPKKWKKKTPKNPNPPSPKITNNPPPALGIPTKISNVSVSPTIKKSIKRNEEIVEYNLDGPRYINSEFGGVFVRKKGALDTDPPILITNTGRRLEPTDPRILQDDRWVISRDELEDIQKTDEIFTQIYADPNFKRSFELHYGLRSFMLENLSQFGGNPAIIRRNAEQEGISDVFFKDIERISKHMQAWELARYSKNVKKYPRLKRGETPKKVLITFEGGGAGHKSAAEAIATELRSQNIGLEPVLVRKGAKHDLYGFTEGKINEMSHFNSVLQKGIDPYTGAKVNAANINRQGQAIDPSDPTVDATLKYLERRNNLDPIGKMYYKPDFNGELTEMAADPRVLGIIDTSPHLRNANSASVATNKPHLTWTTDYGIWPQATKSIFRRDPKLSTVGLTSADPTINKGITSSAPSRIAFPASGGHHIGDPLDPPALTSHLKNLEEIEKLKTPGDFRSKLGDLTEGVAVPLGFPVRPGIGPVDPVLRREIRESMGVGPDDKVIVVTLGSQGRGETLDVVREIANDSFEDLGAGKIHLVVLPGTNSTLKKELTEEWNNASPNPDRLRLRFPDDSDMPFGRSLLDGRQIGQAFGSSDLVITKPGGGAIAETQATGSKVITTAENPMHEANNITYVQESGLGVHLPSDKLSSITTEIRKALSSNRQIKDDYKPISWKKGLSDLMDKWKSRPAN